MNPVAGALDTTFGTNGLLTTDFNFGQAGNESANALAAHGNGFLVVGTTDAAGTNDFAIIRFDVNGQLDTTFGVGGRVITDFGGHDVATRVVVLNDGSFIVAGYTGPSEAYTGASFAIARYLANGTVDTSFNGTGLLVASLDGSSSERATGLALVGNQIVVGGYVSGGAGATTGVDFVAARFSATTGALDSTFGTSGWSRVSFSNGAEYANTLSVDGLGRFLLAGSTTNGNSNVAVARLTAGGALDTTFGGADGTTNGWLTFGVGANEDVARAITVQGDGRIVLAGSTGSDILVVRVEANGEVFDSTFGNGGFVQTSFSATSTEAAADVVVQSDGKVVVAGYVRFADDANYALVRYTDQGALDSTFENGGLVSLDVGLGDDFASAVLIGVNGNFLVAGSAWMTEADTLNDFAVARFIGDDVVGNPPVADAGGPYTVDEGGWVELFGGNSTAGEGGGGLIYEWDLDGDGLFGETGAGAQYGDEVGATPVFSAANLDGPSELVVRLRVVNDAGRVSDVAETTLVVRNVAPTATVTGPATGSAGQSLTFDFDATDPSLADTAAGFQFRVEWGDGQVDEWIGEGQSLSHTYAAAGNYTVRVLVFDDDGGLGMSSRNVSVSASDPGSGRVQMQDDPLRPGKTLLVVNGTNRADAITLVGNRNGIEVFFGRVSQGTFSPTSRVVVYGQDGNDILIASGRINVPVWLDGGAGNDILICGGASNVLIGGSGDDLMFGGAGRDILIGGAGRDTLLGGGGSDVLVSEKLMATDAALFTAQSEWNADRKFKDRVAKLKSLGVFANAIDDGKRDKVEGGCDQDWIV